MRLLGVGVALLLTLGGCAETGGSGGGDEVDQSSLACDHFRNVSGDASQGLLTDAEMREKMKEVHSNAAIATPEIRAASTKMLSAITSGELGRFTKAIGKMDSACTAAGH